MAVIHNRKASIQKSFIKSPLNYTGGKFGLLHQIVPHIPKDIGTFVDLFGGGFNVGVNVSSEKIIYNDVCRQVVDLMHHIHASSYNDIHNQICNIIDSYGLSRSDLYGYEYYGCNSNSGLGCYNKLRYAELRNDYNRNPDDLRLYTLIVYSFNNQVRFNSSGHFNMPCGKRDYNKSLQSKLKKFSSEVGGRDVVFTCHTFDKFDFSTLTSDDFIYCDPPYLNSTATYNESNGWTLRDEQSLLEILDSLNDRNIRWALSNNLKYKNELLWRWKDKYRVHHISANYSNCNYHKVNRNYDDEVLITNYTDETKQIL